MKIRLLDKEATGRCIRELRRARHITVEQLADMLGLESVQAVYKWQRSDSMPTIDNLVILSGLLGVTPNDIIQTKEIDIEMDINPKREPGRELSFFMDSLAVFSKEPLVRLLF